jgi:hypothetical protein
LNDDLDPSVLGLRNAVAGGDGKLRLAKRVARDGGGRHGLPDQLVGDRLFATLRKRLIEGGVA